MALVSEPSPCVNRLKVLADPTRLAVLETLIESPQHVTGMMSALGVEQSLLSHHLKVLRDAGLVEAARDGKSMLYRIAAGVEGSARGRSINLGCCRLSFEPTTKGAKQCQ